MTNETLSDKEEMLQVNETQKKFYESRHAAAGTSEEQAANCVTNWWTWLRRRQQACRQRLGIQESLLQLHRRWFQSVGSQLRVLDLGCFSGNDLSLELARGSEYYLGIDLCEEAIASLNQKLQADGIPQAEAQAVDFLNNKFDDGAFDLVYAHSVLHHFRYFDCLRDELHRVLAPGGAVISIDPLKTSCSMRLARRIYRPFQSDKDWEFPFMMGTFRSLEERFSINEVQGVMGFAKYGLPLMLVPGLGAVGTAISSLGNRVDCRYARRHGSFFRGFFLRRCLQVTMLLEKK